MLLGEATLGDIVEVYVIHGCSRGYLTWRTTHLITTASVVGMNKFYCYLGWKPNEDGIKYGCSNKPRNSSGFSTTMIDNIDDYVAFHMLPVDAAVNDIRKPVGVHNGAQCSNKLCSVGYYPDAIHDASKGTFICTGCKLWNYVYHGEDESPATQRMGRA